MTDRELLELAAKVARNGARWVCTEHEQTFKVPYKDGNLSGWNEWNPLTDDGDALRLAVKLGAAVYPPEADGDDATVNVRGDDFPWISEPVVNDDPYAATRRAIVRAAAALGKDKT